MNISLLIRGSLGAIWGLIAVVGAYMFGAWLPEVEFIFYPMIFAGAVPAAVLFSGKNVSFLRAMFLGLISGLIYALLSPLFPLLAAILAGASLGGGLSQDSGEPGALWTLVMNTLKGAVVLPIVILAGSVISGLLSVVTGAPLYHWLFWGFWFVIGARLICCGSSGHTNHEPVRPERSAVDDFRSEAREISREISELNLKLDR